MTIRSIVLLQLSLLIIAIWLVKMTFVSEGMLLAVTIVVVAVILWRGILCMVRYYRRLGRKGGPFFLLLPGTLLVSAVVLMPLIVGLSLIAVMIFACFALLLWLLSMLAGNSVVVNSRYYKRCYVTR